MVSHKNRGCNIIDQLLAVIQQPQAVRFCIGDPVGGFEFNGKSSLECVCKGLSFLILNKGVRNVGSKVHDLIYEVLHA